MSQDKEGVKCDGPDIVTDNDAGCDLHQGGCDGPCAEADDVVKPLPPANPAIVAGICDEVDDDCNGVVDKGFDIQCSCSPGVVTTDFDGDGIPDCCDPCAGEE